METKHTPLPWVYDRDYAQIRGPKTHTSGGLSIASIIRNPGMPMGQGTANAAFIVKAVNMHSELVDGLKNIGERPYAETDDLSLEEAVSEINRVISLARHLVEKAK